MLATYDPFGATSAAFRALEQFTGRGGTRTAMALAGMPMDAYRVGENFVIHFDLPGVDPGSIDLSVEGTTLTVAAERSVPQLDGAEWVVSERPFGSYTRQIVMGRNLDLDQLEASYHDGILTVSVPVADRGAARKIAVNRTGTPTALDPSSMNPDRSDKALAEEEDVDASAA